MHVRAFGIMVLLIALFTLVGARAGDVRVVLPFQQDADPAAPLERVDPDRDAPAPLSVGDICDLIASAADKHALPRPYFARLIWQESRFDANAVSPAGARGIAQFMPATALRRGLRDAFDPREAIPASAAYLTELRGNFGNLGLAAAAYNAGEERLTRWLTRGGYLPLETENYVLSILGKPAEDFREAKTDEAQKPLAEDEPFEEACRSLPVRRSTGIAVASARRPVWGVQVAGHFDHSVAMRKWTQIRSRYAAILGESEPAVFTAPSTLGRKPLHVVQIGTSSRRQASHICNRLRLAGGSCVVVKN